MPDNIVESQTLTRRFDNLPLAKKLTLGFGIVLLLMITIVATNFWTTAKVNKIEHHINDVLFPVKELEIKIKSDINESLAALRGYLILNDQSFERQRDEVWERIDLEIENISDMSTNVNLSVQEKIDDLKVVLEDFSAAQAQVAAIAHTADEQPASKILLTEAAPRASQILGAVTAIINEEKTLAATSSRKNLLALLADSRGSFAVGLASIRAYLLSGDDSFREDFTRRWAVNEARFESLKENAYLFNDLQRVEFEKYSRIRAEFAPLPPKMFAIRGSNQWNMANYSLAKNAAPKAVEALSILNSIEKEVADIISANEQMLDDQKTLMGVVSLGLLLLALIVGVLSAWFITKRITESIGQVNASVDAIAAGDLGQAIQVTSTDEVGNLLSTIDSMRLRLRSIIEVDVQSIIDNARAGDLSSRIDTNEKVGSYKDLCEGVNELIAINDQVIDETVNVFSSLAHGNLDISIDSNYAGAFARIKKDANFTIEKLQQVIQKDIQLVVDSANQGDLSARVNLDDKEGFFLDLSEKVNEFVSNNQQVVGEVANVFSAMSRGDLNQPITSNYQGEFLTLKKDANSTLSSIKEVIEEEIQTVVNEALKGNLAQRINVDNKQGFFKDLSRSINQLTDISSSIINDASMVIGGMAEGDLTKTITKEYEGSFGELKNNINSTIHQLKGTIEKIYEAADLVNSGSSEISIGVDDLSARTEQQAASLEETAASMEQMTSSVKQSSSSAKDANDMTVSAEECAVAGGSAVDSAIKAMGGINEASNKIAAIIGVIDEIAFQTNLLALNAAVEAARAGEQGRGFAVVAGEVRTLAQRSAGAAKEIKDLINDSVERVDNGSKLVNESGETLKEIVESVKKVGDAISHLSTAGEQQYVGIQQVNSAVLNMDQMTQQNAALVEQSSAACQGLSEQAQKLTELVSFFKTKNGQSAKAINKPIATVSPSTPVVSSSPTPAKQSVPDLELKTPSSHASGAELDGDWEEF